MAAVIAKTIELTIGLVVVIFGLIAIAIFNIVPYILAIWAIMWAIKHFHYFF